MRLSFDGIQRVAQEMVGAEVILGDIVVCDSPTKRKRKMLQRTATGYMIYYGRLDIKGQEFEPLADHSGQVKRINREIL
jgi:hypothetical protein